jgi:imidazolonepropionase-like amidohydrolase
MVQLQEQPWLPRPGPDFVLTNASVVDVETGTVQANSSIYISRGVIQSITTDSKPSDLQIQVIDIQGKYVIPGLIDCHVHLYATPGSLSLKDLFNIPPNTIVYRATYVAKRMLLRGFTTARDTGGADASLRDAIAEGILPGPRLFIAGKALSQTGGHGDFRATYQGREYKCCGGHAPSLGRVCDGVPECLTAVRDELRQGANFIKIMCGGGVATPADPLDMLQFTNEEIQAITTTAGYLNTYVTAHAYTSQAIRHAVDNGVKGIEHGNFVDVETAKYCADKGVFFTPTLVTYYGYTQPPFNNFLDAVGKAKNEQVLASGLQSLKILRDAGVTMCYGSDLLSGLHVLQNGEFSLRAKVLSAKEILQSCTINAAKMLRQEGKLGCLKSGSIADLIVLDQNPLEDITVLDRMGESMGTVIKDGRVVSSMILELKVDPLYLNC